MYIKSCIFLAYGLALVSAGTESKGVIQDAVDACAVKQDLPPDQYENFVSNYMNITLDDCVAACAMKKLGTMSDDGVFTGEKAKFLMAKSELPEDDDDEMDQAIEKCATMYGRGGKNVCETVRSLQSCYEVVFREIMDIDWCINGLINQALLFTFENYAEAYPVRKVLLWTLPNFSPFST